MSAEAPFCVSAFSCGQSRGFEDAFAFGFGVVFTAAFLWWLRLALDLMSDLKLAVHIGLDEIRGDEFYAMLIIAEEGDRPEREKLPNSHRGF